MENCTRLIEVIISQDIVKRKFAEIFDQIQKSVRVPGYRLGNAPRDMVEKQYAQDAKDEVLKDLIPEHYANALQEHSLEPVDLPRISDIELKDDSPLSFKATVSVRPDIQLKGYKGLGVKKKRIPVSEEDVEKYLSLLQDMNAKYTNVTGRAVKKGDYVICDMKCTIDGKCTDDRKNAWLFVDENYIIKDMVGHIVDMKEGDQKIIEITLPQDYQAKEFAGKKAVFDIKLHQIKQKDLPKLDDEFAKEMGDTKNLDELKGKIRQDIQKKKERDVNVDMENQLIGALLKENSHFEIPASLVERQLKGLVEDAKSKLMTRGFKKEDVEAKAEELNKNLRHEAQNRVRLYFILDEIAKKENIIAQDPDIDDAIKLIAQRSSKTPQEVKDDYQKNDLIDNLAEDIREEKILKFLLKEAKIEDEK